MPRYEYSCDACDLTFEVSRSFQDSDLAAACPMCDGKCRKVFSVPLTYSRGAAFDSPARPDSGGGRWSHHGHSHGPGGAAHSH